MTSRRPGNPLRTSASFRRLWIARTVSHVGDGIAVVALVLYVQGRGGSGSAVGGVLLAASVPRFLGPFAGVIADRVEQRTLMVACDLARAAIFGALAWLEPPFPGLIVLVAAASTLDTVFEPAGRSVVPSLVREEELLQANAWMGTSLNLQVAVGSMMGGALVAALGARGALATNAISFLASAAALIGLPRLQPPTTEVRRRFLVVGIEGLAFAWRSRAVRLIVVALFFGVAFAAVDNVALVFLIRDTLGAGPVAFGLVTGAYGVGMLAGSLGLTWRATALAATTLFALGWLASGIGLVLTSMAPLVGIAATAQVVAGLGNGIGNIAGDTLIQRAVPREMLGRVFGLYATAAFAGSTLALSAAGFLLDLTSPRTIFAIGGGGVLAVYAFTAIALRRASS